MDSVGDILGKYRIEIPDEITAIKEYVAREFDVEPTVSIQGDALVITVRSASLANALRLRQLAIQKAAKTTKRLLFRIG